MKVLNIVFAAKDALALATLATVTEEQTSFRVISANSFEQLKAVMSSHEINVVVIGEELADISGLECVKSLISFDPFINCALQSPLYPSEFHQQTEGLGVFMQLPAKPDREAAIRMIEQIKKLYHLDKKQGTGSA